MEGESRRGAGESRHPGGGTRPGTPWAAAGTAQAPRAAAGNGPAAAESAPAGVGTDGPAAAESRPAEGRTGPAGASLRRVSASDRQADSFDPFPRMARGGSLRRAALLLSVRAAAKARGARPSRARTKPPTGVRGVGQTWRRRKATGRRRRKARRRRRRILPGRRPSGRRRIVPRRRRHASRWARRRRWVLRWRRRHARRRPADKRRGCSSGDLPRARDGNGLLNGAASMADRAPRTSAHRGRKQQHGRHSRDARRWDE